MKKTITLCILAIIATLHAWAAYPPSSYQLSADSKTLLNWNGPETAIDLTSDPVFNQLTTISGTAFRSKTTVTSIKLVNTVNLIQPYAFANCTELTSLTLSTGLTSLGNGILLGCSKLTQLAIPASVTVIEDEALSGCSAITSLTLPANLTKLGASALRNTKALTTLTLPTNLNTIGTYVLEGSGITSIALPAGITVIPEYAFANCTALNTFTMSNNVTDIKPFAFTQANLAGGITLSNTLTRLGHNAFYGSGIKTVALPSSLTLWDSQTFMRCGSLTSVTLPTNPAIKAIPVSSFSSCVSLTSITIPGNIQTIENYAFFDTGLTSISLPNSVTSLKTSAFYNSKLASINIGAGVTLIENNVITGIPTLTNIGVDAANPNYMSTDGVLFNKTQTMLLQYPSGKTNTTYTVPATVTAVYGIISNLHIQSLILPEGLTTIGEISSCANLTSINFPSTLTTINNMSGNIALVTPTISSAITMIDEGAFAGNTMTTAFTVDAANPNYKSVNGVIYTKDGTTIIQYPTGKTDAQFTIPSGVTRVGRMSFYRTKVTEVFFPNSLTQIGLHAFSFCALTSLTLPNSIVGNGMEDAAFYYCTNLTSVTLPQNITYIGYNAFDGTKISSIFLPASINYIATQAFANCTLLRSVECANPTPPTLYGVDVFKNIPYNNAVLTVPLGSRLSYQTNQNEWANFTHLVEKDFTGATFWLKTTASPGTPLILTLGNKNAAGSCKVDWGDGNKENNYTLGVSTPITGTLVGTPTGTPAVLTVRVYGAGINTLDIANNLSITEINTINNSSTTGDMENINISRTGIKVVDVAANINLIDLNISSNTLSTTALNLSANTKLENLNVSNTGITSLTLPTNTSSMRRLNVAYNKLNLGTLPAKPANVAVADYIFSPQTRYILPQNSYNGATQQVDLSSQLSATTNYVWKTESGATLVNGTDYTITGGKTKFLRGQTEPIYCEMRNAGFLGLRSHTGTASSPILDVAFRTTPITSLKFVHTWKGTTDTNWGTASNWGSGTVPSADDDVIMDGTSEKDLQLDADRTVNNFTNSSAKAVIIPTSKTLTVQGTMISAASERVLIKSSAGQPNGATTPGYNPGQYISVPLGQAGYMGLPDTIPSMQGFLVRTLGGSGVMTIPYSATAKNIRPQYAPEQDRICLIIDVKSENSADRVWLFNRQGTSSNFDNGWDGRKMIMNGATQIYAAEQGGNFQVSTNEELNGTYIAFQPGIDTEYTMTFNPASIESKYQNLYLLDTKNGVVTEINKESSYRFTSEKTDNAKRFKIVTSHTTTAVDLKKADTEIVVFSFDNIVYVNNNTNENATMIIYDISGVEIQRSTINAKSDISITTSIPKGIYVVNIKTTSHNVRKQIAIR